MSSNGKNATHGGASRSFSSESFLNRSVTINFFDGQHQRYRILFQNENGIFLKEYFQETSDYELLASEVRQSKGIPAKPLKVMIYDRIFSTSGPVKTLMHNVH